MAARKKVQQVNVFDPVKRDHHVQGTLCKTCKTFRACETLYTKICFFVCSFVLKGIEQLNQMFIFSIRESHDIYQVYV